MENNTIHPSCGTCENWEPYSKRASNGYCERLKGLELSIVDPDHFNQHPFWQKEEFILRAQDTFATTHNEFHCDNFSALKKSQKWLGPRKAK